MSWVEKQPEVLKRLESDVEAADWKWLNNSVDLECPDLEAETTTTAAIRERFRYRGHLNVARVTRTYIWQCWLKVQSGEMDPIEGNIRSFWYQHLEDFYRGHGLFDPDPNQPPPGQAYVQSNPAPLGGQDEDDMTRFALVGRTSPEDLLIATTAELMADFVNHHIFRFGGEFQFQRPIGCKTLIGRDRKKLLFFTEKEGMWKLCEQVHQAKNKRSISVMASDGEPSLLTLEYFAEDFRQNGVSELVIGTLCDYDPWGFWIAWNLDNKLSSFRRQGVKDAEGKLVPYFKSVTTYLLTTPDLFTKKNLKDGRDLTNFKDQTLIQNWMEVTHGVEGKPLGLHVDQVDKLLRRQRIDDWIAQVLAHVTVPYKKVPKKPPTAAASSKKGSLTRV